MNKINHFNNLTIHQPISNPEDFLSPELLDKIFTQLDSLAQSKYSQVNRRWKAVILNSQKIELKKIQDYAHFLGENTPESLQKNKFLKMAEKNKQILASENLNQINSLILATKEKILQLLKPLSYGELKKLEELQLKVVKFKYFENTFTIVYSLKEIHAAYLISDIHEKRKYLQNIFEKIARIDFDLAFNLAKDISPTNRDYILEFLSR